MNIAISEVLEDKGKAVNPSAKTRIIYGFDNNDRSRLKKEWTMIYTKFIQSDPENTGACERADKLQ
ncbi:4932_t:CDS:2, partial [Acaulospora morrowiae]